MKLSIEAFKHYVLLIEQLKSSPTFLSPSERSVWCSVQEANLFVTTFNQLSVRLELEPWAGGFPSPAPRGMGGWSRAGSVCRVGHLVASETGTSSARSSHKGKVQSLPRTCQGNTNCTCRVLSDAHCCAGNQLQIPAVNTRSVCLELNVKSSYQR